MRVLIVKTSSLGDVVHALPAVTDAVGAVDGIRFDWVVEESLAEIPAWHPAVDRVIPVALRRWRRRPLHALFSGEWRAFRHRLRERHYDLIIDAQGLLKSALLARLARGRRCGLSRASAREPLAALAYQARIDVPWGQHAVTRVRQLFGACLGYTAPAGRPDYGLSVTRFAPPRAARPYLVFLHGTTWVTKLWPERYWLALARQAVAGGYTVYLPWGTPDEAARARRLADGAPDCHVLGSMNLGELAGLLEGAAGVVAVDTGLGHLAAALGVPCVTIYGATRPGLTGTMGPRQAHIEAIFECAPCLSRACTYTGTSEVWPACYTAIDPPRVWQQLASLIGRTERA